MLVALNLLLAGGGIALIHGYLNKRDLAAQAAGLESSKQAAPGDSTSATLGASQGDESDGEAQDEGKTKTGEEGSDSGDGATVVVDSRVDGTGTPDTGSAPTNPKTESPGNTGDKTRGPADAGVAAPVPRARVDAGRRRPPPPKDPAVPPPPPDRGSPGPADAGTFAQPPPLSEEEEAERVHRLTKKIKLVVSRQQAQLTRCYQNAAKFNSPQDPLEGRIKIHFAVHPDGFARSISVVSNNTGSPALANCIVGLVGSWTFPSSGGDALDFVWPFEFQAPK